MPEFVTGVALHQWKRGKDFRKQLTAPEGYDLCEFDFAGQEFRWMAVESGDETMLQLCQPGEDAHSYMGSRIARCDYRDLVRRHHEEEALAEAQRKLGKVANLALQYRTSAATLKVRARTDYRVRLSLPQSQAIWSTYQTTYRGVPRYWERQIARGRRQGYVETQAGRRIHLGFTWPQQWLWSYESACINFPIQGVGADQKYLALAVLRDLLPQFDGKFYFELHDGLFVIVRRDLTPRAVPAIKRRLSSLPYERAWGVKLPIKFPVDAKVGPTWGDLHEWKEE